MSKAGEKPAGKNAPASPHQLENQFLPAWTDPVAGLSTFSAGICTENLYGDGHRLLVADEDGTLKIWSGQTRETEQPLLESPVAITSFHVQDQAERRIAIAAGPNVYIFLGTKPHFKATMPVESVHEQDLAVWQEIASAQLDTIDAGSVVSKLQSLADSGVPLCRRSACLGIAADDATAQAYITAWRGRPVVNPPFVTAMVTLHLKPPSAVELAGGTNSRVPSTVIIATEASGVLMLSNTTFKVEKEWQMESVPSMMCTHGSVETGYTIFVTLRNGVVRVIRDGELEERHITLPAVAVGVAVAGEDFYAAVSSGTLELYTANTGERSGAVMLPSTPVALTTVPHASAALVAVALRDCAVLLFCGKTPISRHETQHVVLGMFGGPLMTEDSALVCTLVGGGLDVRFLSRRLRTQQLLEENKGGPVTTAAAAVATDPPALPVPKKTKLYVEFARRERDNASEIYNSFQQDLVKLRLKTAEAYVKVLTGTQDAVNGTTGSKNSHLTLSAGVSGLGPNFQVAIKVMNTSQQTVRNVKLVLTANGEMYSVAKKVFNTPALVPGLPYTFVARVVCLAPETGFCGDIRISLVRMGMPRPLISATVTMPVSEIEEE